MEEKFSKFLKFLLFLLVIFITPKVFAAEYNITNKIKALTDYTSGSYYGVTGCCTNFVA